MSADIILQAVVNGLLIGGIYAVISVGLTLVFGVMDIVNFAQAEFLMIGMYLAYLLFSVAGIDPILAAPIVFILVFGIGAIIQRLIIQPVLSAPMSAQIFLTVGLSLVLVSSAQLIFGADFRSVITPYQTSSVLIGPLRLGVPYLMAFGAAAVLALLLWLFLERTEIGRMMRATAQNRTAALLVGINTDRMYIVAFALGTALAAAAGAVILPYVYVYPTIGHTYSLIMFTVVVLGGLGSVTGAVVGGLIIGVVHSMSATLLPTVLQNFVIYLVFIGTLMLKPSGLFRR